MDLANPKLQRELMSELGKLGAAAIKEKYKNMSDAEKKRIVKKARKTRRQNKLLRVQAGQIKPKSKRALNGARACVVHAATTAPSCSLDGIGSPAE
jgi:hypothetical protein